MSYRGFELVLYIGACLVVPALWGATTAWLFRRADAKTERRGPDVDYVI